MAAIIGDRHPVSCACCDGMLKGAFDRRGFLRLTAGGLAVATLPGLARAEEGGYEAMVLSCIDPRFIDPVHSYLGQQGLTGKYSQFVIAGAAIGVVAPAFKTWHKAFWDNLAASIQLHRIKRVIAIDHRDCGAARIAYGDASIANPTIETKTQRDALGKFRRQVAHRQSHLAVETGLMALDGTLEMFT